MEITATQAAWKQALDTLRPLRAQGGSSALPILNCVLMQADATGLTLTRTDRERQLRTHLPAETVSGTGELAVDARKLDSIIAALPAGSVVKARQTAQRLTLAASLGERVVARFTMGALPGEDFPLMAADTSGPTRLTLPGTRLAAALHATAFAMARQDVRYYLNGLLLEWRDSSLLMVATDGHRLAHAGLAATVEGDSGKAIIPGDTIAILAKIGAEVGDDAVTLALSPQHLAVAWPRCDLVSKLIDGQYPDWRRVVPSQRAFQAQWRLSVADFAAALTRVRILSHEQFRGVALEVRAAEPGLLYLHTVNAQQDDAEEAVALAAPAAAGRWGFQVDYLLDVTGHCLAPELVMQLGDAAGSALLGPGTHSSDEALDDPEWVVMPMLL